MKKSERLHHMLRFINQKQRFTLQDLMDEFQISKRTALRDIAALEAIGAPIYVEYGRYGGYRLMNHMQLPPISFTSQEVYALYFAMQSLQRFINLPFQVTLRSIQEKFLKELRDEQRIEIERMQKRISFGHTAQLKETVHLETVFMGAVKNKVLHIMYQRSQEISSRTLLPIAVYPMKGYWYCQAYDLDKRAYRVLRCDRIISAKMTDIPAPDDVQEFTYENAQMLWKPSEKAIHFTCLLNEAGIERFEEEHYPSMKLIKKEDGLYLSGSFEEHELEFITKYLASFGKNIKIIKPMSLKEALRRYLNELLEHI